MIDFWTRIGADFSRQAPMIAVLVFGAVVLLTRRSPRKRWGGVALAGILVGLVVWHVGHSLFWDRAFAAVRARSLAPPGGSPFPWHRLLQPWQALSGPAQAAAVLLLAWALVNRRRPTPRAGRGLEEFADDLAGDVARDAEGVGHRGEEVGGGDGAGLRLRGVGVALADDVAAAHAAARDEARPAAGPVVAAAVAVEPRRAAELPRRHDEGAVQ